MHRPNDHYVQEPDAMEYVARASVNPISSGDKVPDDPREFQAIRCLLALLAFEAVVDGLAGIRHRDFAFVGKIHIE